VAKASQYRALSSEGRVGRREGRRKAEGGVFLGRFVYVYPGGTGKTVQKGWCWGDSQGKVKKERRIKQPKPGQIVHARKDCRRISEEYIPGKTQREVCTARKGSQKKKKLQLGKKVGSQKTLGQPGRRSFGGELWGESNEEGLKEAACKESSDAANEVSHGKDRGGRACGE